MVRPESGTNWVLITTAWHMPRSMGIFCKVGWEVTPYPVDFYTQPDNLLRVSWGFADNLNSLVTAAKEWVGLVVYRLTGKICWTKFFMGSRNQKNLPVKLFHHNKANFIYIVRFWIIWWHFSLSIGMLLSVKTLVIILMLVP